HRTIKNRIEAFLRDIDQFLTERRPGTMLDLYHLGRSALVWHYDSPATTRDIDVLHPRGDQAPIEFVIAAFGQDTVEARRPALYLEPAPELLPPVAIGFEKRATQISGGWTSQAASSRRTPKRSPPPQLSV